MGKSVLVFGGSRYFGKRLVEKLIGAGHKVTLATRGITPDGFGNAVERLVLDREKQKSLSVLEGTSWDLVFDQMCYSPQEALWTAEILKGRVGRYVFTSTQSTYPNIGLQSEEDFNPYDYKITMGSRRDMNYGEAKRSAEAVLFQGKYFPVVAMRIPIVLGPDDYTGRLEFHLNHVAQGTTFSVINQDGKMCFISSQEAADFLFWLGEQSFIGPINAASPEPIAFNKFISIVEEVVGKKALISDEKKFPHSPLVGEDSRYLNVAKAMERGYKFKSLDSWLLGLIREQCRKIL